MHVRSLIRVQSELQIVEIELSLIPGLPVIHFLGLPDQAMRESIPRIRSAIRAQGFQLPKAHQILVNLKPSHLRKSSRGLDLAVAAALLWETDQLARPPIEKPLLYGELTLKGEVVRPDDLAETPSQETVWTGIGPKIGYPRFEIYSLNGLRHPTFHPASLSEFEAIRPQPKVESFDFDSAEIAALVAAGEHSLLLAGPHGSGKSTLAESIPCWVEAPDPEELRALKHGPGGLAWRPTLQPHHSATSLAMIGGGAEIWAGEIVKAHQGILIMDELLEFKADVQEALREPMDSGSITLARAGSSRSFPARVLILAATNLCRCGKFVPTIRNQGGCRCTGSQRRRSLSKLSGPFLDRLSMIHYMKPRPESQNLLLSSEIALKAQRAIEFRRARNQLVPNAWVNTEKILVSLDDFQRNEFFKDFSFSSFRRRNACLRVARTLADLDQSARISNENLNRALELCVWNHQALEKSRGE